MVYVSAGVDFCRGGGWRVVEEEVVLCRVEGPGGVWTEVSAMDTIMY